MKSRYYVRPALYAVAILVCMLWYVTADASVNSTNIFLPPEPGRQIRPQSVPEPEGLAVLAVGVAAAMVARRRRKGK